LLYALELSPASDIMRPLAVTWLLRIAMSATLVGTVACNKTETPTSPTTTTPAATIAEPTVTEEFAGTVTVGGFSFYSFTVEQNGTVQITLANVGGTNVPSTVWLGLGIGIPAGEDCATTSVLNTQAATSAQLTGTYAPGIYCARVHDIGNLVAPATFTVSIAHP
jgi:hypothetical protein